MNRQNGLQRRLHNYVRRHLLYELGCTGDHAAFVLQETPLGIHNRVFFLDVPEVPRVVLKAVRSRRRFHEMLAASSLLKKHGIPAPDIVHARPDRLLRGRLGVHLVCERFISGGTLQEKRNRDQYLGDIARFFASLHAVTRPWWGKPGERRPGSLYDYLKRKIKSKLTVLTKHDALFLGKPAETMLAWTAGWKAAVDHISSFSLSHCDPNPANILTADNAAIYLLDTGGIRYLPRTIDYFTLQLYLSEGDEHKAARFDQAYAEAAGADSAGDLNHAQPFFKLYVIIHFMSRLAFLCRSAAEEGRSHDEYKRYIALGRKMISDLVQ